MSMNIVKKTVLTVSCFLLVAGCAMLSEPGEMYNSGLQSIRDGNKPFAFMHLKSLVESDPQSPYAKEAEFAVAEYYFDISDYYNSIEMFSDYISRYPKDKGAIFAKLLIYKMLAEQKNSKVSDAQHDLLIKEIRKELFSKPLFLIFYDKKSPRAFHSLFKNTYLVYDYVDKIRVLRNDKIFLELSP
jgi:hypothetical protein